MQKTKMIFTIGPASDNKETLREFIKIGMSAARLNFSHGTYESHLEKINILKDLRKEMNSSTAILIDIKGPKIRTHNFKNDGVTLKEGDKFSFICGKEILGDETKCSISYDELYKDVKVNGTILVDDGLLEFKILEIDGKEIKCEVVVGGDIKNHKGVNVPNVSINLPAITEKDAEDLKFACKVEADFVAASFIRKASDILEYRKILNDNGGKNIKIIAKIESQEGVNNVKDIIEVADGIMVARGDMGVEIPIEKVPIIQKKIIKKCNTVGKIVITATQMLDSMIRNSRPTRAEACDICNAIFDGTDAIMLSGESASGLYPILAAKTMSKIAKETEDNLDYEYMTKRLKNPDLVDFEHAISYSAAKTANKLPTKAIVAATKSGVTARLISRYKPCCPIIAITPEPTVARSLALNFGVLPRLCKDFKTTEEILSQAKEIAKETKYISEGDTIMVAAGPTSQPGGTNMLKIETV
ncbi:pyruvate kinase [Clostridium fallax]|uniref:Pyruvate kinase n=1 Tax=Clostridium fallax TaxID=1533 RepID=A0A1M4VBW5_9CLOT|nr:pyruvate kinase [Clostridium fallax]SHE66360.1 pyruvate kinase [Clostridium fallax]SQB05796.1 pyruvate kinase [Clostridium fallax]